MPTYSLLTSGSDGTDTSSYTTASISPTVGRVVLVAVNSIKGSNATVPTISGASTTWTQVATVVESTFTRCTLFRGVAAGSGALTIDFSSVTHLRCAWDVIELSDVDTGGTNGSNAIVQSATNNGNTISSISVTLSSFSDSNNATLGCISLNDNVDVTSGSGFSEISDDGVEFARLQSQFKNSNDTGVDWSWTGSLQAASIAVELKYLPESSVQSNPMFFSSGAIVVG